MSEPSFEGSQFLGPVGWAVLEAAPEAIVVLREEGKILSANRRAERLFGFDRGELEGVHLTEIIPSADPDGSLRERSGKHPKLRAAGRTVDWVGVRRDARRFPVELSRSTADSPLGILQVLILRDVTERRRLEDELRRLSARDALTGLFNRTYFEHERSRLDRGRRFPVSVIAVDVDGLKAVNDSVGHAAGDTLIRRTAALLRGAFRDEDVVARTGGDEFVVLLPSVDPNELKVTMGRLRDDLRRLNELRAGTKLGLSIGGATAFSRGGLTQAILDADRRMYDEKREHVSRHSGARFA